MDELILLLENYWVIKERNPELYYRVKEAVPRFKSFIEEKLGFHCMVHSDFIKLEKYPMEATPWMGIETFQEMIDYVLFGYILIYLEDKGKEEQFILSQLTEFISANYEGEEEIDWTKFSLRKSLVRVIKQVEDMGLIKTTSGKRDEFAGDENNDALFESTGMSRYVMKYFTTDILDYQSYIDFEYGKWNTMDQEKGVLRRYRAYQNLVARPVVYQEEENEDFLYYRNYRGAIENDIQQYLACDLHLHKNGVLLVPERANQYTYTFPKDKTAHDIILQVCAYIRQEYSRGQWELRGDDCILLTDEQWEILIQQVQTEYLDGWSKEYREMPFKKLQQGTSQTMIEWGFLSKEESGYLILPLSGKVVGEFPKEFIEKRGEEANATKMENS